MVTGAGSSEIVCLSDMEAERGRRKQGNALNPQSLPPSDTLPPAGFYLAKTYPSSTTHGEPRAKYITIWCGRTVLMWSTIHKLIKTMEMKETNIPFRMTSHLCPLTDIIETLARTQGSGL